MPVARLNQIDIYHVPLSQARLLQEGVPNVELAVIENSGRFSCVEKPKDFGDAVCKWLGD
jgi:pimeloyl-ACP methyl ester carboxylesterase